jgi:hypothetical protein
VGLAGSVLVAASPLRPVLAVGMVSARRRDDGAAQHAQHFGNGDRDQAYLQAGVGVAVQRDGDGQVHAGEQAQGATAVPGPPADHLTAVQPGNLLGELVIFLEQERPPESGRSTVRSCP